MSDLKFSCPQCGQNILCDTSHSGLQIPCPECQNMLTIPPALSVVAASMIESGGKLPPGPPPKSQTPARSVPPLPTPSGSKQNKNRYSTLAIASLLCSVWVLLGFIPGII